MIADSIKFRGHRCFKNEFVGFDEIKLINVIIGRNNTGKSHLLDLVAQLCDPGERSGWEYQCRGTLAEEDLRGSFHEGSSGGRLQGNHWRDHGQVFVGQEITWKLSSQWSCIEVVFPPVCRHNSRFGDNSTDQRIQELKQLLKSTQSRIRGRKLKRLSAERDIFPEASASDFNLAPNGAGASNVIRRFLLGSDFNRDVIYIDLLKALNSIFQPDCQFSEITVRHIESSNKWEVFLGEKRKGLVPLSNSGSGLKTAILVLLNLLAIPKVESRRPGDYAFAFEELENNLHPALLRRLLKYIEAHALEHKTPIFLTTHSSVTLDVFGPSPYAQFIHVTHDGESARTTTVKAHFDHLNVISELGAKPSDLLQANGIIWVEGPSDRIYINKWIELFTWDKETQQPRFREGRDYQCAFYGGALLSRLEFKGPGPATNQEPETPAEKKRRQDFTDLLRVNPNIAVLCDSDRTKATDDLKPRVQRIQSELEEIRKARDLKPRNIPRPDGAADTGKDDSIYANAHLWITGTRDIENYLPGPILDKVFGRTGLPDPQPYATFFPKKKAGTTSYLKKHLDINDIDKVELAILATEHLTLDSLKDRLDWSTQMQNLTACIEAWNK